MEVLHLDGTSEMFPSFYNEENKDKREVKQFIKKLYYSVAELGTIILIVWEMWSHSFKY